MRRLVEPEILDELPPTDPQANGSRADLRRLNYLMGHAGILSRAFGRRLPQSTTAGARIRLVELGAGDGTLLLRLAREWSPLGVTADVTLLDRQQLVSEETHRSFAALDWSVECVAADVMNWLGQPGPRADVMFANLFLHHFPDEVLAVLLRGVAARTRRFIACEPRRSRFALNAARLLRLIGCNPVTRHDAVVSVRAGFGGRELSALWPAEAGWSLREHSAGWFSHCFVAGRND